MNHKSIIIATSLLVIGGLTSSFFISDVANALGELWFLSSNNVRPNVSTWGIQIPSLTNCNTIDTSATGVFSCGTDSIGTSNWQFIGPNAIRPTTTVGIIVNASSTFSQVLNLDNYLSFTATSTPTTPATNHLSVYAETTQGHTKLVFLDDDGLMFTMNRDNVFTAKNTSGSTINKGQAVYITGSTGNVPNVSPAQANSTSTLPAVGLATANISNNAFGEIMILGIISSIDTSAFSTGDRIFVSPTTAGNLTNVRPAYSNFAQRMGSIMVSGVGNGSIYVTTAPFVGGEENWTASSAGFTAKSLTISANGSATTTISGSTTATSTIISGLSAGNNAAFVVNQAASANSFYIATNGNVGIGTTAPVTRFDIKSSATGEIGAMRLIASDDTSEVLSISEKSGTTGTGYIRMTKNNVASNAIVFDAGGDSWFNTGGNVGIATTSPRYTLDVYGDFAVGTTTGSVTPHYPLLFVDSGTGGTANGVGIGTTTVSGTMLTVGTTTPAFVVSQTGNVGIGTTTPTSLFTLSSTGSLALPYGNPTVDNSGEIGINTDQASSSIRYYDGTAERAIFDVFEKSFWVASTTDDENNNSFNDATSTFTLWNPARRITLVGLYGKTDNGTVNFACGDGTNWTETIVATATGVEDDGSMVNNTFTQREDFQCKIGSAATVPSKVTITTEFRYEAD